VLFLSYAAEDGETARVIAEWLASRNANVFRYEDPERRGGEFIKQIEDAIYQSDAFLVLLSPSYLASDWCRRERNLALQREQDLQADNSDYVFIQVLKVHTTPDPDTGFLRGYDSLDLTDPAAMQGPLDELARRLRLPDPPDPPAPTDSLLDGLSTPSLLFRNREEEIDRVVRGITSLSGPHFWLVIAPPQLGKTWFLQRVRADPALVEPIHWVVKQVDLRKEAANVRSDMGALLSLLFDLAPPVSTSEKILRNIAKKIIRSRRPHLCLLDSAELLDSGATTELRLCLGEICRMVQDASDIRLALVVASRRDDEWKGVTPYPRLSPLPLTEFNATVVQKALRDLAQDMGRIKFTDSYFTQNSLRVHRFTEGLPALLVRCLKWIRESEWVEIEDLESQEIFDLLADPYIEDILLARDSLLPGGPGQAEGQLHALKQAFRVLVPYRLFTQSHLRHHDTLDAEFRTALTDQKWSIEDTSKAITGTALLLRPLTEPWQEIHAAIRRLLYRYFYRSSAVCIDANSTAGKFDSVWASSQSGKEQVVGLVETLWHQATMLLLNNPDEMETMLSDSARALSRALRPSNVFTVTELRDYAAERMRDDEELEESVSIVKGLFSRLIEIVVSPL
jgi:hypothetical protein